MSSVDLIAEHGACNGLLVDALCIRMYDSLRIISCTLVHPHDSEWVLLLHSGGLGHITSYVHFHAKHEDDRLMSIHDFKKITDYRATDSRMQQAR